MSAQPQVEPEPVTPWRVCLGCGGEIELILWVLGSVRCMDCRVDAQQAPLPKRPIRTPRPSL